MCILLTKNGSTFEQKRIEAVHWHHLEPILSHYKSCNNLWSSCTCTCTVHVSITGISFFRPIDEVSVSKKRDVMRKNGLHIRFLRGQISLKHLFLFKGPKLC